MEEVEEVEEVEGRATGTSRGCEEAIGGAAKKTLLLLSSIQHEVGGSNGERLSERPAETTNGNARNNDGPTESGEAE